MADNKLTRAEQVRAKAFDLAIGTVAGRGDRTFHDLFPRAEEIEHWLYKAREPVITRAEVVPAAVGDWPARNGRGHAA